MPSSWDRKRAFVSFAFEHAVPSGCLLPSCVFWCAIVAGKGQVPEGHLPVARRFNAGLGVQMEPSSGATTESPCHTHMFRNSHMSSFPRNDESQAYAMVCNYASGHACAASRGEPYTTHLR